MDRLAQMQAYLLVVDTGSFSAASRRPSVGQPAVSKTIAQLEERLEVKLLARTSRGLTPTEAGLNFYERARRVIEEADEAELAARGAGSSLTGKLRLCAAVTFARIHLMPQIPTFLARHPRLEMDIVLDDRNIDLVQEGIDVALRMGKLSDSSLTARKIAAARRVVVATSNYLARAGVPKAPGDLLAHEAVIFTQRDGGVVWTFKRGDTELSVTVNGRIQVSAGEGVRAAVLADAGLAVASEWMFSPELANGAPARRFLCALLRDNRNPDRGDPELANDKRGYWVNGTLLAFADIPFVLFVLVPGLIPWWPALAGPLLWLAAFTFSSVGRFFADSHQVSGGPVEMGAGVRTRREA